MLNCSDDTVDFQCTSCWKEAVKYCIECQQFYCETCTDAHNKIHGQHTLKNQIDFPFIGEERDINDRCLVHGMKVLDKYCTDHDDIGCEMCIFIEHGSCSNVRDISESIQIKIDPSAITERLKMAILRMGRVKKNRDDVLAEISEDRKHSINTVKKFRKDLERVLVQLEKASIEEIETEYDAKEISVRNQLQGADDNVKRLEQSLNGVKTADQLNSKQMFVSIKSAEKMLRSLKLSEKALSTEPQPVKDRFQLNTNISRYLTGLRSFGDRHTFEIEQTSFQVQNSTDIDVKVAGETGSWIHDSCLTPDCFFFFHS